MHPQARARAALKPSVLIIEDEASVRSALAARLAQQGYAARPAKTAEEGLEALEAGGVNLVLLDYRLPDADGLELLAQIRRDWPEVPAVMMTAFTNVDLAIQAIRSGAYDYVSKPFSLDEMMVVVDKALEAHRLRSEVRALHVRQQKEFGFDQIVARSPQMAEIVNLLRSLAESEARTILLEGESGTGKDLAAKVLHYNSPRSERPFMNITCTALPEALLESELFGHEKGAFTDARKLKQGLVELADGGTLFLDEIGDMPAPLQAKLLRFLEEKAFRRVGGTVDIRVDIRIVAATNQNLRMQVARGIFREDLFYRLNIFPITLPPLRERTGDIPLLVRHFIEEFNREFRKDVAGIDPDALEVMQSYHWPGNVRELKNLVERAMLLAGGEALTLADLPGELKRETAPAPESETPAAPEDPAARLLGDQGLDLTALERDLVARALAKAGGNQTRAARLLGLSRDQLRYRVQKFDLQVPGQE